MTLIELNYQSEALGMRQDVCVLIPRSFEGRLHPILQLHGLSDDRQTWLRRTRIDSYAFGLPVAIVMPDARRSFYVDAVAGEAMERALGVELVKLIEKTLPVLKKWAVGGLSMGGYGAIRLALRFPLKFVSAVSHSGALLRPSKAEGAEWERIFGANPTGSKYDLRSLASRLPPPRRPSLWIDCGTEDFLLDDNRGFHEHLVGIGYEHEYHEFPGEHNWDYWDQHVKEGIAFHRKNLGF